MAFWIFMLLSDLLIPLIMLGFGKYSMKNAPKKINYIFGYRTSMSMKNKDTWMFAHNYCGKLWYRYGLLLLPTTTIGMCFVIGKSEDVIGNVGSIICCLQLIPLTISIFLTEKALKKTFDKNGNRR